MTKKKEINTDFEGKSFEERCRDSAARVTAYITEAKTVMRDKLASQIIIGICAGDWRFDIPEGKTWDEVAAKRAYELADAMIKEREITNV